MIMGGINIMKSNKTDIIWKDRKRFLGLPLSFTKYEVKNNRLYTSTGFLSTKEQELLLYRILDFKLDITLGNRLFKVGTITLYTCDETDKEIKLIRIKNPKEVRDILSELVEQKRGEIKIKGREMYGALGEADTDSDNIN